MSNESEPRFPGFPAFIEVAPDTFKSFMTCTAEELQRAAAACVRRAAEDEHMADAFREEIRRRAQTPTPGKRIDELGIEITQADIDAAQSVGATGAEVFERSIHSALDRLGVPRAGRHVETGPECFGVDIDLPPGWAFDGELRATGVDEAVYLQSWNWPLSAGQ